MVPGEIFANCHLNREVVEKLSGHRHRHQEQVASLEFDDNGRIEVIIILTDRERRNRLVFQVSE